MDPGTTQGEDTKTPGQTQSASVSSESSQDKFNKKPLRKHYERPDDIRRTNLPGDHFDNPKSSDDTIRRDIMGYVNNGPYTVICKEPPSYSPISLTPLPLYPCLNLDPIYPRLISAFYEFKKKLKESPNRAALINDVVNNDTDFNNIIGFSSIRLKSIEQMISAQEFEPIKSKYRQIIEDAIDSNDSVMLKKLIGKSVKHFQQTLGYCCNGLRNKLADWLTEDATRFKACISDGCMSQSLKRFFVEPDHQEIFGQPDLEAAIQAMERIKAMAVKPALRASSLNTVSQKMGNFGQFQEPKPKTDDAAVPVSSQALQSQPASSPKT